VSVAFAPITRWHIERTQIAAEVRADGARCAAGIIRIVERVVTETGGEKSVHSVIVAAIAQRAEAIAPADEQQRADGRVDAVGVEVDRHRA
jgi:hypothetical protein